MSWTGMGFRTSERRFHARTRCCGPLVQTIAMNWKLCPPSQCLLTCNAEFIPGMPENIAEIKFLHIIIEDALSEILVDS
jgi:hypothetical protein